MAIIVNLFSRVKPHLSIVSLFKYGQILLNARAVSDDGAYQ